MKRNNERRKGRGLERERMEKERKKGKETQKELYVVVTYRESKRFVYHYQSSYGQSDWLSAKMHQKLQ